MKCLVILALAACGGGVDTGDDPFDPGPHDAPSADAGRPPEVPQCNPVTQTACNQGEMCTWVRSTDDGDDGAPGLGSIGCAPEGTVVLGGACTVGTVVAGGYDDCGVGGACYHGVCERICEAGTDAGSTCPGALACVAHVGLFANAGATTIPDGVCE